jgi:FAD synthase
MESINGSKIKGIGLASKMGYPTINLKLSKPLKCGMYTGKSNYGDVIILIGNRDNFRADCHFINFDETIDKQTEFILNDIQPLIDQDSEIISTYNKGCQT